MPCRPSSAVQRCTQVPQAPSPPTRVAISGWTAPVANLLTEDNLPSYHHEIAVPAEEGGDLVVVAGEVVLGQEVDHQRGPADVGDLGLLDGPGLAALQLAGEVPPVAPGDVLVRHPVLGDL